MFDRLIDRISKNLKPCPKCGEAWLQEYCYGFSWELYSYYKVNCICGYAWAISKREETMGEAVKSWNELIDDEVIK